MVMGPGPRLLQEQRVDYGKEDVDAQGALAHEVLVRCLQKFPQAYRPHAQRQTPGQKGERNFYIGDVRDIVYGKTRGRRAKHAFGFEISEDEIVWPPYAGRSVGRATVMVLEDLSIELRHREGTLAHPPRGPHARALVECALKGS